MAPAAFPLIARGTREESETDVYSIDILRNQKFIIGLDVDSFSEVFINEPPREKTNNPHMRKQRRRSASR